MNTIETAWSWRWGTYEAVHGRVYPAPEPLHVWLLPDDGSIALETSTRRLFATRAEAQRDALETARREHERMTGALSMLAVRIAELERETAGTPQTAADADREFDRLGQIDAELRIPVVDEDDEDPDSTPLEDEHGDPVGSRLEPAGAANDHAAYHGDRSCPTTT